MSKFLEIIFIMPSVIKPKFLLTLICQFACIVFTQAHASAPVVNTAPAALIGKAIGGNAPLTASEVGLLEPVCVLVLSSGGNNMQWYDATKNNPILEQPAYHMAKGAISLHHYCYAEIAKIKLFRERNPEKRSYLVSRMLDEYGFVIREPEYRDKSWPYLKKVYVEYGKAALLAKKTGEAIAAYSNALQLDPGYDQAYIGIADLLISKDNKKDALERITEGLKHNPNSRPLRRKYKELGGGPEYPQPYAKSVEKPIPPVNSEINLIKQEIPAKTEPPTHDSAQNNNAKLEQVTTPSQPSPEATKNKGNPYCRFCP